MSNTNRCVPLSNDVLAEPQSRSAAEVRGKDNFPIELAQVSYISAH
jgi:hypothetical protein